MFASCRFCWTVDRLLTLYSIDSMMWIVKALSVDTMELDNATRAKWERTETYRNVWYLDFPLFLMFWTMYRLFAVSHRHPPLLSQKPNDMWIWNDRWYESPIWWSLKEGLHRHYTLFSMRTTFNVFPHLLHFFEPMHQNIVVENNGLLKRDIPMQRRPNPRFCAKESVAKGNDLGKVK